MHDIGDALALAGFADPVMDAEWLTLTYDNVDGLMRDLKLLGATNATMERPREMTGRGRMDAMRRAYESFRMKDGRFPATYEVVQGHAWVAERLLSRQTSTPGESLFPVSGLRSDSVS
jgi:malonyl-CoA O-methyltransferase